MVMVLPTTWTELIQGKSFIIGLKKYGFRREHSAQLLRQTGFSNLEIVDGWDGYEDKAKTDAMLKEIGIELPPFEKYGSTVGYGHKGCTLSHVLAWRRVIDLNLPYCFIFEDDVIPHTDLLRGLGQEYWSLTLEKKRDFDILYLGNMINPEDKRLYDPSEKILESGTYCLHAYLITLEGANRMLSQFIEITKARGFIYVIDVELYYMQSFGQIKYACWNGTNIPKPYPSFSDDLPWQFFPNIILPKKDTGLFYQNFRLGTSVGQEELQLTIPKYA